MIATVPAQPSDLEVAPVLAYPKHDKLPSFSWDARAAWHGKRLAREGYGSLHGDLIGRLAWHEGADVTVQAMDDFAAKLQAAFRAERDRLDNEERTYVGAADAECAS